MPSKKKEVCSNADKNPICPYLTQINQMIAQGTATNAAVSAVSSATNTAMMHINDQADSIKQIKKALVGDDMQGGLVKKFTDLESQLKTAASWANFGKPIILGIIMAVIAGIISHYI